MVYLALPPEFNFNRAMLVKYNDRVTIDGALALQQPDGLQKLLNFVRTQNRSAEQLPYSDRAEDAVRFMHFNGQAFTPFNEKNLREAMTEPVRVAHVLSDQSATPEIREKFLNSDAHSQLPFTPDPLVFGTIGSKFIFAAGEGQSGRKYRHGVTEVLKFFATHPEVCAAVLPDIEMRIMFEQEIKTVADLERFVGGDLSRLDFVLDFVSLLSAYLTDSLPAAAPEIKNILALNPSAGATIDFRIYDPPAHKFPHTDFAAASNNLRAALAGILKFAKANKVTEEAGNFAAALELLDQPAIERGELWQPFKSTSEGHTVEEAYRLFRAAVFADNFAGMSSWNDIQIEKTEEFRRVSNAVVISLLDALCASVDGLQLK